MPYQKIIMDKEKNRTQNYKIKLDKALEKNEAKLVGKHKVLNQNIQINFECKCGDTHSKTLNSILFKAGARCKKCMLEENTKNNKKKCLEKYGVEHIFMRKDIQEKRMNAIEKKEDLNNKEINTRVPRVFTLELIQEALQRDNANIMGRYDKLSCRSKITFICNCGEEHTKNILIILDKGGAFCKKCTNKTRAQTLEKTNMERYGEKCTLNCKNTKEKAEKSIMDKYGCLNFSKLDEIQDKIKKTNMRKYNVEHVLQSDKIKRKIKNTIKEKYGVEFIGQSEEIKEKIREKNLIKYGCEWGLGNDQVKQKGKMTNLKKFGYKNVMHNPSIADKSSKARYKSKDYRLPSDQIIKIQGYENYALDKLLYEENIDESDIITGCINVPTIWYYDNDGVKRRHFVDIFIPSQNRCIEVKSDYTITIKKSNIFLKQEAGKKLGYEYEIWVFKSKGKLVEKYL